MQRPLTSMFLLNYFHLSSPDHANVRAQTHTHTSPHCHDVVGDVKLGERRNDAVVFRSGHCDEAQMLHQLSLTKKTVAPNAHFFTPPGRDMIRSDVIFDELIS